MKIRVASEEEYLDYHWKRVRFSCEITHFYEYTMLGETVWFYKDGRKPGCSCQHGSNWGTNKPFEYCKHIRLVKKAIKERGKRTW